MPTPSQDSLLLEGTYLLTVSAVGVQGCSPPAAPLGLLPLSVSLMLTQEQGGWIARSAPREGYELVLHLRETGRNAKFATLIGTIEGMGVASISPGEPPDLAIWFPDPQPVAGTAVVALHVPGLNGQINGPVVFINAQQPGPTTCPGAEWILGRSPF
jgi:hypothetical protein